MKNNIAIIVPPRGKGDNIKDRNADTFSFPLPPRERVG